MAGKLCTVQVNFPLAGLDLTPYLSGPLQQGGELFDLFGCVQHSGSVAGRLALHCTVMSYAVLRVTGGHYTAYAKHMQTNSWHHYNDSAVSGRAPEGSSQDETYVLFYKRAGLLQASLPASLKTTGEQQ